MADNKTLILVRHAKSSWKDTSLNDIQRPLNKRGKRDAPKMGKYLLKSRIVPQAIFSSTGLRALTTARLISVEMGMKPSEINIDEKIYTFNAEELLKVVKSLKDKFDRVMIVGHNPAVTDLVNYLCGSKIDNIPTCGVALLRFPVNSWKKISKNSAELLSFDYPKKLW